MERNESPGTRKLVKAQDFFHAHAIIVSGNGTHRIKPHDPARSAPELLPAEQRTDGLQQHGADNWFAQIDAVGNPGRSLPPAILVLRGDEDRWRRLGRCGEMVE